MKMRRAVVENQPRTDGRTHGQRQLRAPTVTTNSLRSRSSIARFASEYHHKKILLEIFEIKSLKTNFFLKMISHCHF